METKILIIPLIAFIISLVFNACGPIKEIHRNDPYTGPEFKGNEIILDPKLKTVVILASNLGTEIFDLMAPYEIFSLTNKLNVVVLAPEKKILPLWKGLYLLPHMSLSEFDQLNINPDMVVIPNIVDPENRLIIDWITKYENSYSYILSVCEGARVIGLSQLYDGSKITTHHSSINKIEKEYPGLQWIRGYKYIEENNLISTSGVAAAVEGSLVAVEKLLGMESVNEIMSKINYPGLLKEELFNSAMGARDFLKILGKTSVTRNKRIGVYISDRMSELELAAIIDTYNRTFPARLETISLLNQSITSRNGLILIASTNDRSFEEVLIPPTECINVKEDQFFKQLALNSKLTFYQDQDNYIFHDIYHELRLSHSKAFTKTVFRLLDYDIEKEVNQQNFDHE